MRSNNIASIPLTATVLLACTWQAPAMSLLEIGILTCKHLAAFDTPTGSSLVCDFQTADGPPEAYSAIIEKIDSGVELAGPLVWTVNTNQTPATPGSLAGEYSRTPGGGLLGGRKKTITLLPAKDMQDTAGDNLADTVSQMSVVASN